MRKISCSVWRSFPCHPCSCLRCCGAVFLALMWLVLSAAQAQTTNYALGTTTLLEGPAAGSDSVVLAVTPATGAWTATTNAAWLHLSPANQSGIGSTNVIFSFDANPGATRSGTLTIASQTLTVTQAGSTYVAATGVTALVSSGLRQPSGVAVDGSGNVYIADTYNNAIKKWTATNNTVTTLVSGLNSTYSVAVDGAGNIYIASYYAIQEWTAANSNLSTLVSHGSYTVTVDGTGDNVYFASGLGAGSSAQEWTATNGNVTTLATAGSNIIAGVSLDAAGNVYIAGAGNGPGAEIEEWLAANSTVTTLVGSSELFAASAVAVDGGGNVYYIGNPGSEGSSGEHWIYEWMAASGTVATLVSTDVNLQFALAGVAVDGTGNIYFLETGSGTLEELPHAFVDPTPRLESLAAGNDALPAVVPATAKLLAPFAPISDQPWLTITGVTNGVVSFAFTATTSNRTANITLLGQTIPVTQGGPSFSLGAAALLEGPTAGTNSVVLTVVPSIANWTATANATWLHLGAANQSGAGSTNVIFSYDANPGATRTGTLTIASQTLTITQAGATYVAAGPVTTLVPSGLSYPDGVTVDGAGNVYIADTSHRRITKWMVSNNTVTTCATWMDPLFGVVLDGAGDVYSADFDKNLIMKWTAATSNTTTLVSSGLGLPAGVAVDGADNVYIADVGYNAIEKWTAVNSNVTTLVFSGLSHPHGVAVDGAGNVYIADTGNSAIKEWTAAGDTVTTLVSSGLNQPQDVAVDGRGNVYIADTGNSAIKEWTAVGNTVTTLVSSGLNQAQGVAVDGAGDVYIADTYNNAIKELPYAFVDPTPKLENANAGSDVLPVVLPVTENLLAPFAPTCDQSWLTISGVANGVVSFSFTLNTGSARTAHITLLGQSIPVTQAAPVIGTPPTLTSAQMLGNGVCRFAFTNTSGATFTVLCTTNLSLPFTNWTVAGCPVESPPGTYQFTSQPTTNDSQIFYGVLSP